MKVRAVKKAIITIKEGEKMDLFEERKKSELIASDAFTGSR